ncbi:MAG: UDP-N-acetylmuramoyl-L-alanyl-D-glutamate--2,6-diaminopimelate ligase [Nitrospirae bacterium]|nr:UDP-N-acetylmuramoyl-L-alanyl-D-glutamate--2,6-diaminopimelate ligase [Nitrospirota bacterium]
MLSRLLKDVAVLGAGGDLGTDISSVVYDSRKAVPGCAFVAVRGLKTKGTDYMAAAAAKGAAAVVYDDPDARAPKGVASALVPDARVAMALMAAELNGRPSESMKVIGITGTNGKTTTAYLIRAALEHAGRSVGLLGTISYQIGGKTLPAPNTTPESVDLQGLLAEMRDAGAGYAVMEVSSHAVSLRRIAGCTFKVKVFTNFTQDHLDYHGTMEDYYEAKKEFFTGYPGVNVINLDDPKGWDLVASVTGGSMTYGINVPADVTAKDLTLGGSGTRFTLVTPDGEAVVDSPLMGRHNAYNILAAAAVCTVLGMTAEETAEGVSSMKEVPGRFEKVDLGQDFAVLVDYAHTDDAIARAIAAAREFTKGRVITLFGCGGDRDRTKRPKMGYAASLLSDILVLTSDNPRSEDPVEILWEIESGVFEEGSKVKGETLFIITDRAEAIAFAVGLAREGDTVLLAGKGHEDYQIIGDRKFHFDDREAARDAIEKRLNSEKA